MGKYNLKANCVNDIPIFVKRGFAMNENKKLALFNSKLFFKEKAISVLSKFSDILYFLFDRKSNIVNN
jgi:hypothetical protein